MRTRWVALAVALGLAVATASCSTGSNAAVQANGGGNRYVAGDGSTVEYPPAKRVAAPHVSGETLSDGAFDLAAHRGNVVVINFWAEWCAPCVLESAALVAVYKSTRDSGVVFVGVNSRDQKDLALAFQNDRLTYPSLFDPAGRIALKFRDVPSALPTTLIIDRDGRVAAAVHAAVTEAGLTQLVKRIVAET